MLEILEELENNANVNFKGCEHKYNTDDSRMKGYFCSDTVFNLSNKVLTKDEIKQLSDKNLYQEVQFKKQMLSNLVDTSDKFFRGFKTKEFIAEKELKYFTYEYKKACNLGKMYLLPKMHKKLSNVPGRPVISNCGMPTEFILNLSY